MKKYLLLLLITSTLMVANSWTFKGNSVAYIQTQDNSGTADIGSDESTFNDFGIQIRAKNRHLFADVGVQVELTGLYSNDDFSNRRIQNMGNINNGIPRGFGGAVTQAYFTYGVDNTSLKIGRQRLPKFLSPFAFTEAWQPLKNSFDALVIINSDISNTTLLYAGVTKSNGTNGADMGAFNKLNKNGDIVHMLTAKNSSLQDLVLTGSIYYAPDFTTKDALNIIWADAQYHYQDYAIAFQAGQILDMTNTDATTALGAKIGGKYDIFDASLSLSYVNDGTMKLQNLGTGVKTPLYTQLILNQGHIKSNDTTVVLRVSSKLWGGKLGFAFDFTKDHSDAKDNYNEIDITFKKKLIASTTLFLGYMRADTTNSDANNRLRTWVRYNF